jgi:MFS superfamily sulfate permease-like transporter
MTGKEKAEKALFGYWKFGLISTFVLLLMLLFDELAMWIPGPILVGFVILVLIVALRFLSLYLARRRRGRADSADQE